MGLIKNYKDHLGREFQAAYFEVDELNYFKNKEVRVTVSIYPSKETKTKGNAPAERRLFRCLTPDTYFDINILNGNTNPIKQAYEFLKNENELTGAQDDL